MEYSSFRKKRKGGSFPNGAIVEGADYLMDMETNQKRRRVMADYEDNGWDPVYGSFLIDLEEYREAKFVEEDEDDPTYVMFLESLKKHGNAYMIDVSIEHGIRFPIKYEDETSSWDGVEGTRQATYIQKEGKFNVDRPSNSGFRDYSSISESDADLRDVIKRRSRRKGNSNVRKGIGSDREDSGNVNGNDSNASHVIKIGAFRASQLGTIREEGNLDADRKLNFSRKNSSSVSKDNTNDSNGRSLRSRQSIYTQKDGSSIVNRELKSGLRSYGSLNEVEIDSPHMRRGKYVRNCSPDMVTRKSPVSHNGSCIPKNGHVNVEREVNRRKYAILRKKVIKVDEAYKLFFDALKIVGDSVVCEFADHEPVFYEKSDELMSTDTVIGAAVSATAPITETCTKPSATPAPNPTLSTPNPTMTTPPTANSTIPTPCPPEPLLSAKPSTSATPLTSSAKAPITSLIQRDTYEASMAVNQNPVRPSGAPIASSRPPVHSSVAPAAPSIRREYHSRALNSTPRSPTPAVKHTKFLIKLRKILRKPYDQKEYDELWKELNWKSPQMLHRSSRAGGNNKYGPMGKSLLEQYPDVKLEIEKAQPDSFKVLNLLRMLSHYLQKLACGRIPIPWKDDDTMKILPGSRAT